MARKSKETVDLVLNIKGNAAKEADKVGKATKKSIPGLKGMASATAGPLAAGLSAAAAGLTAMAGAAVGAVSAYARLVSSTITLIDETNTLAQATGLSHSSIAGLRLAADAAGKSLADILPKDLAKKMDDARRGSKAVADSFAALGVEVTTSSGELRDADAVYRETVSALLGVENSTERSALAFQVLGKQGRETLSAFGGNIDAFEAFIALQEQFARETGPEAAAAAGQVQTAMSLLGLAIDNVKRTTLKMGPGFELMSREIVGLGIAIVGVTVIMAEGWSRQFRLMQDITSNFAAFVANVFDLMAGKITISDFFAREFALAGQSAEEMAAAIVLTIDSAMARVSKFKELAADVMAPTPPTAPGSLGDEEVPPTSSGDEIKFDLDAMLAGMESLDIIDAASLDLQLAKLGKDVNQGMAEFAASEARSLGSALGSVSGVLSLIPGIGGAIGTIVDLFFDLPDILRGLLADFMSKIEEWPTIFQDLFVNIPMEIVESLDEIIEANIAGSIDFLITTLIRSGTLLGARLIRAVLLAIFEGFRDAILYAIPEAIDEIEKIIKDAVWQLQHLWRNKESEKGMRKSALAATAEVQAAIQGDAPRLALGGLVTRPTFAMVGEAGPEAVIPLSKAGGMMPGSSNVANIAINVQGYLDDRARRDLIRDLNQALGARGFGPTFRTS